MTEPSTITRTIENHIATVTINNPPGNLLNSPTMAALESAFRELSADDAVKAVILTGAGMHFITGADIREIAQIPSGREGEALAAKGQAVLNAIEAMDKPVIAAINGMCLGGGLELAMACHIRIAAERARLGQPEINLGIMPGFGGTQRLPRLVGSAKALEMILTGDMISAQEARESGLVSRVVPDADLLKQATGLAKKICSKGRVAVKRILEAVRASATMPPAGGLALEAKLFGALCDTDDKKEGIAAFLQKRQPKFTDR